MGRLVQAREDEQGVPRAVPARLLSWLVLLGASLGLLNLLLDGALRPGGWTVLYAATMGGLLLLGVVMLVRNPALRGAWGLALVLTGNVVYGTVVLCLVQPGLVATPVMLLFSTFVAGWLLGPRLVWVHLVSVVPLCWLVLSRSITEPSVLAVQVAVNAGVLGSSTLVLMVLRMRIERLAERNHLLSRTDPLTGLANHRGLVEQAPGVFAAARAVGARVVVAVLDLDHFKQVNDRHGHATGDAVLVAVATRLREQVPVPAVVARTGGEEVVVLAVARGQDDARGLGEHLRLAVRQATAPAGVDRVTVSVGVALEATRLTGRSDLDVFWRLAERADTAMYAAKRAGRDRCVVAWDLPGAGDVHGEGVGDEVLTVTTRQDARGAGVPVCGPGRD